MLQTLGPQSCLTSSLSLHCQSSFSRPGRITQRGRWIQAVIYNLLSGQTEQPLRFRGLSHSQPEHYQDPVIQLKSSRTQEELQSRLLSSAHCNREQSNCGVFFLRSALTPRSDRLYRAPFPAAPLRTRGPLISQQPRCWQAPIAGISLLRKGQPFTRSPDPLYEPAALARNQEAPGVCPGDPPGGRGVRCLVLSKER
ncbi:hypothetical protein ANANG_G00279810 [Anguilla anguilla]|uniref:Uncharacterized protein n=1 Tax=Anguilla anguilla TaxID=7936 RepID=A0A9D3LMM8_ANGAN|nr:hypothetical protein ANANG_G00279810 [Anguilla anguilla]